MGTCTTSGSAGAASRVAPPETPAAAASADPTETSKRQDAAVAAVNWMAVRRGAHAEMEDPEMGRLVVDARRHDGQVDISVAAQRPASVEALEGCSPSWRATSVTPKFRWEA